MTIRRRPLLRCLTACVCLIAVGSRPAAAQAPAQPAKGEKAKPFTLESLDGKSVSLKEINSRGPVVLLVLRGYPGYQCPLCTAQVRDFVSKAKAFADRGATLVMVYPGPADNLKKYAAEFFGTNAFPDNVVLLIDPDYAFTDAYGLRWNAQNETAYPSTLVIDKEATIRYALISRSHGGRSKAAAVLNEVDALK